MFVDASRPAPSFTQHGPRPRKVGGGDPQIGIRGQRLFDQASSAVVEQAPPTSLRLILRKAGIVRLTTVPDPGLRYGEA